MNKSLIYLLILTGLLLSETLFEVKDALDNPVLNVSTDGIRVMNEDDTLMVISSDAIRANIGVNSKGLSRAFSVTTTSSKNKGLINSLEVDAESASMTSSSGRYTNFSPENIFIGLNAGTRTDPNGTWRGMNNIFLGNSSGYWNDWGTDNIFIGDSTGFNSKNTDKNIFIGNLAGFNTESDDPGYGSSNVFIGVKSGYSNIEGMHSVYVGQQTGEMNYNGTANVFIGSLSGRANNSNYNTAVGGTTFYKNTSGSSNTTLGSFSGYNNLTGSRNVFLGYKAGYNETGSDKLYIDNSDTSTPLIWGDFSSNQVRINGLVGVNAANSSYGLYVIDDYISVYGNTDGSGTYIYGLYGDADGGTTRSVSVYGSGASGAGTNWAGYFNGDVNIIGSTVKSADVVQVDHPADPENKYLSHSGVISDQMTTVYNGNIVLDESGSAEVKLPEWFESFNKDFKYQLTAVGAPGPNLYISRKIENNTFGISGGTEGMEVSWQVTGVRNDNYARKNPMKIEKSKKPDEKGYYLHPDAYGLSEDKGIEYQIQKKQDRSEKE